MEDRVNGRASEGRGLGGFVEGFWQSGTEEGYTQGQLDLDLDLDMDMDMEWIRAERLEKSWRASEREGG